MLDEMTHGPRERGYSPAVNPLTAVSVVHTIEELDDAEFVETFAEGVRAGYKLSRSGYLVFRAVLDIHKGSNEESVDLCWSKAGLNGGGLSISKKEFQRGLKELLSKKLLAPRAPSSFWVKPSVFCKGDRFSFVVEYRRAE